MPARKILLQHREKHLQLFYDKPKKERHVSLAIRYWRSPLSFKRAADIDTAWKGACDSGSLSGLKEKTVPDCTVMLFRSSHGPFSEKQQQSCSRKRSMRTMHEREAPGITWSTPPRPARAAYMVTHHSTSEGFHRQRARFKLSPADAPAFPGIMHFQNRCLKRSPENPLPFRSRPCPALSPPPSAQLIPHFQHMRLPPVHICRKKFM